MREYYIIEVYDYNKQPQRWVHVASAPDRELAAIMRDEYAEDGQAVRVRRRYEREA